VEYELIGEKVLVVLVDLCVYFATFVDENGSRLGLADQRAHVDLARVRTQEVGRRLVIDLARRGLFMSKHVVIRVFHGRRV
jgi:hypothetical protein